MKLIVGIILVLAVLIGGGFYLGNRNDAPATIEQPEAENSPSKETGTATEPSQQPGIYVDYSSSVVANTAGTKILFFHAPWCPQCRELDQSIKSSVIPSGVTIIKTDYDTNQALRQKYGVTIQTTLVKVDDQGNFVKKYVAYDSPTLESLKENLL
ncbi:MAG: thioredoxin domain-containing protein [bacterium]|nr:thioredoxin domain-containing protein [bacterium]